jgi:hypothetical protein
MEVVTPLSSRKISRSGRDRGKLCDEFLALLEVGFRVPLAGVERLFSAAGPNLRGRYQICGRLSLTPAWLRNFN